jgi:uncharacterized membrane protein
MNRWIKLAMFAVAVAVLSHLAVIGLVPRVIMSIAMDRIAQSAGGWNTFHHAPRVTATSQQIVRSSPDLAYSTCAVDLAAGPVRVHVHPGGRYASVAVYAGNTDVVTQTNDLRFGSDGVRLLLVGARSPVAAQPGEQTVSLPSSRGLVLVRRLAPTAEAFELVDAARRSDSCAQVRAHP